jgi:hypothetical protein
MPLENDLKFLVTRALGAAEADRVLAYQLSDLATLHLTAEQLLRMAPESAGASVLMGAAWALHLRDKYNLPAVTVVGDLKAAGRWLFRTTDALPDLRNSGPVRPMNWRGHCWVEVGGMICDVAIIRTIESLAPDDEARLLFQRLFEDGRSAFIAKADELPEGLQYRRRAVLSRSQMIGFFENLRYRIEGEREG